MSKVKDYLKENYIPVILFLVLSVIEITVVLPIMYANCLSYDSSYQYGLTLHSLPEIFQLLPADYHPPFYAVSLKLYCMVFGYSLTTMRTFSIFAVVGMLFIAAFPVNTLFGKRSAVYCELITFCSTALLNLLNETRPTLFAMFFYMAAVVYAGIAFSTGKRYSYICLVFFSVLAMYTHNVAMVGVFCVYAMLILFSLIAKNWKKLRNFFICGGVCAVLYLPWLKVVLTQAKFVKKHFWQNNFALDSVLDWVFNEHFSANYSFIKIIYNLTFFLGVLSALIICLIFLKHIRFDKIKGAKAFKEVFTLLMDKSDYLNILLLFSVVISEIAAMEIVCAFVHNLRQYRYYAILAMAWIVVLSAVFGKLGNKICCRIYMALLLFNHFLNVISYKQSVDNFTMDQIVSDVESRCVNEDICFLHTHEYSLGLMSYYFPNAKHFIYSGTFTVLRDFSVFGTDVIEIDNAEDIWDYTGKCYTFSNMYANCDEKNFALTILTEAGNCEEEFIDSYIMTYDYAAYENYLYELVYTGSEESGTEEV